MAVPTEFVSVPHIRSWPYKNGRFNKAQQFILERFFNVNKFFARTWDIYHHETSTRDHFLLPLSQVQAFLTYIHTETNLTHSLLNVPKKQLLFSLPSDANPIFCGTSTTKKEWENIVETWGWKADDNPTRVRESKEKKKQRAFEKRKLKVIGWRNQVKTARQVLGLGMHSNPANEVAGEKVERKEFPVLVAVDVEAWERDNNRVTEIGIATLDTAGIPDWEEMEMLKSLSALSVEELMDVGAEKKKVTTRADRIVEGITYRHLRIIDNQHLRNGMYVNDCADRFDFGESEWVKLADVPRIMGDVFRFFNADGTRRKIMLVGHDVKQDLQYLRITGYDVWNIKDLEVLDTAALHKAVTWDMESRSLARCLSDMGILYWNLHNAGNDAAYTMQAFVRLADRGVVRRPESEEEEDEEEVPEEGLDYEELVASKCITYSDDTLGPRARGRKRRERKVVEGLNKETEELERQWGTAGGVKEENGGW